MQTQKLEADLHVHSRHSRRPSQWVLRKLGAAESYTDPQSLYTLARDRGMDLVTVTDHNTLAGSLEIAHLENTFVSEEVTTYFPADGCKLHVLAYHITEAQHEDISRLRENVFDLVDYFLREGIVHALAHPMYPLNDRLTPDHFEEMMLLFRNVELNGSRDTAQNRALRELVEGLTQDDVERFAHKHRVAPRHRNAWKKNLIAGSDDHSSLLIATSSTSVAGAASVREFLQGIEDGRAEPRLGVYTPERMARTIYSVTYQFYKEELPSTLNAERNSEPLLRLAERILLPATKGEERLTDRIRMLFSYRSHGPFFSGSPRTLQGLLLKEARDIICQDPEMRALVKNAAAPAERLDEVCFRFVDRFSEKVIQQFGDAFLESVSRAHLFHIFHAIGSVGSLYTLLLPYFVSFSLFRKDGMYVDACRKQLRARSDDTAEVPLKMAHFTDTLDDVNGVARTLRLQAVMARKNGKQLEMISCGPKREPDDTTRFDPVGVYDMPEYPGMALHYPPFLKMLRYCYQQGFTHLHAATPGPMGLAALALARILNLPLYGTYHTALPQYVNRLMEDPSMGELAWKYVVWFYNQMDIVYVPSRATGAELAARGVDRGRIRFYPRGIDTERFHPSKANGFFQRRFGLPDGLRKILYVGRVSQEKNLPLLAESFRKIARSRKGTHLVVVGDGPYQQEMHRTLHDLPVTFTGFLAGEELAEAYASSDLFVFPSTTDTFGNVVLEAQASGLPVIVTDQGGPRENMIEGKTGLVVPGGDTEALAGAVSRLLDNPDLLKRMKENARAYMQDRSFEAAFLQLWKSYAHPGPAPEPAAAG